MPILNKLETYTGRESLKHYQQIKNASSFFTITVRYPKTHRTVYTLLHNFHQFGVH